MEPVVHREVLEGIDVARLAVVVEAHQHDDRDRHEHIDQHEESEHHHEMVADPFAEALQRIHTSSSVPDLRTYNSTIATMMIMRIIDNAPAAA